MSEATVHSDLAAECVWKSFTWSLFWRHEGCRIKVGVMESCTVVPDCLEARQCVAGFESLEDLRGHCVKLWRWSLNCGDARIAEMVEPWRLCRHRDKSFQECAAGSRDGGVGLLKPFWAQINLSWVPDAPTQNCRSLCFPYWILFLLWSKHFLLCLHYILEILYIKNFWRFYQITLVLFLSSLFLYPPSPLLKGPLPISHFISPISSIPHTSPDSMVSQFLWLFHVVYSHLNIWS